MPQTDTELFDPSQFQAELSLKASPIAAFKKAIARAREVLDRRFLAGHDIRQLVRDRAWFVDQILQLAWQRFDWSNDAAIALLAVGGYGRGELHPYSDIDLLILLDGEDHELFREPIEGVLTLLWDIGLDVGQSVHSVDECAEQSSGGQYRVGADELCGRAAATEGDGATAGHAGRGQANFHARS